MSLKRKRDDQPGHRPGKSGHRQPKPIAEAVEEVVNKGLKELTRALKQAKGFERQRLGKRQKQAFQEKDVAGEKRISTEIAALKVLEPRADLAQHHLYKVLLRTKTIKESDGLPPFVRLPPKRDEDTATANVMSRLFRAKEVKKVVEQTVDNVKRVLGLAHVGAGKATERVAHNKRTAAEQKQNGEDSTLSAVGSEDQANTDEESGQDRQQPDVYDRAFESDGDFSDFKDRVAASSEDSERDDEFDRVVYQRYEPTSEENPVDSSRYRSQLEQTTIRSQKPLARKADFLPALSMGGYISGSDSEPENLDALGPPRKNRRGQRARQQIWEKKFGGKAKHLHKEGAKSRDDGWDARYGAQLAGERRKPGQPWKKEKEPGIASGSNDIAVKPRKPAKKNLAELPLHPSWEAKKLAKEKQAQSVAFTGKRISFD